MRPQSKPLTYGEAVQQIYKVLKKHIPTATDEDLSGGAHAIATLYQLACEQEPFLTRRGSAAAMKRLLSVNRHLVAAGKRLQELGPDEKAALLQIEPRTTQAELMEEVAAINKRVAMAYYQLETEKKQVDVLPAGHPSGILDENVTAEVEQVERRTGGRPPDILDDKVTAEVGQIYWKLTGKKPGRVVSAYTTIAPAGSFTAVLTEILGVLGLKSSIEYRARSLSEKTRK